MYCECHQIGGPFIAEDPSCPVHGAGGSDDRLRELDERVRRLEQQVWALGGDPTE